MNYYYLKLGQGNTEATSLQAKKPTASVYFDAKGEAAYKRGAGKSQPQAFWEAGEKENRENTIMVVIHQATVWLLQPGGKVSFSDTIKSGPGWRVRQKKMPVRVLAKVPSKLVPPVLASMGCSQGHGRRTFTRIKHWGNLKAIDWVLQEYGESKVRKWLPQGTEPDNQIQEHWRRLDDEGEPAQGAAQLLECLSSTEVETLVAKLLEAHDCYVPAHRGGTLAGIDLFASNETDASINLDGLKLRPREKVSLQVKTWAHGMRRPKSVDYLIGFGVARSARSFGAEWLLGRVKESPPTLNWLKRSLNWLPPAFLTPFGL